ncbi:MAG: TonB-dependent siderophore receptor [Pseudomonadota bacterium]
MIVSHFPKALRGSVSLSVLAIVLSAAVRSVADAQEPIELETVVIKSQEDATGPVDDQNNPLTVTGSKNPIPVNQIPQSISVLGRNEIEQFNATRTSEALRYTAGVTSDVFGNDTDYDWLRVRGFQADQTGIYWDNAQNLSFAFGSFYIDPYTLERIEVLRGPSSALYGGSNPGGIINYVSKRPGDRIRQIIFGGNNAFAGWAAFDIGDDLGNDRSYRVTGRFEGGKKFDDLNRGIRGTLAPSFRFVTGGGTEVTILANLHAADEKHNGSTFLPYYGTVVPTAQFGYIDPDSNFSDPDWDSYDRKQGSVTSIVEHEFDNGFTFTGVGRLGYAKVKESYYYPFGYLGFSTMPVDAVGTLSLIAFEHNTEVKTAQTDLRYYGEVEIGGIKNDLLFGLDARGYWIDETQASAFLGLTNTVVNTTAPGTPVLNPPYQDALTKQKQLGLYFQDILRFDNGFIVTGNVRHDFVYTSQNGAGAFKRSDSEPSYRVALGYEAPNGMTPYVSYASFFNPLIVSPANGVTEPETGTQIEFGFKWAPDNGPFRVAAALFQIDRNNVVTGAFPNFDQLGAVRSRGFEIEGAYDFGNGLRMAGAATVLDAKTTKDSNAALIGKTPTLIPDHELALKMDYAFSGPLDGFALGVGVRHRGESYANADNTLKVSSFTIVDMSASYQFKEGWLAKLAVTNIANKRHVTACQTVFVCSYGSGREAIFTLTRNW